MDIRSISRQHFGTVVIGIAVIVGIGYWIYSSWNSKQEMRSREQATQQEYEKARKQVEEFRSKHNALADWKQELDKKEDRFGLPSLLYTVDVQNALVRTDARPILFFASVVDITRDSNSYQLHLYTSSFTPEVEPLQIHLFLDCNQPQVDKILPHPQNALVLFLKTLLFDGFAVVAHVSEVHKVRLALTADGHANADAEDVVVDIGLKPSLNVFYAKGECLDVLFVGDYRLRRSKPLAINIKPD